MSVFGFIAATADREMYHRQYFSILGYSVEHMFGHVEFIEEADYGLEDLESRRLRELVEKLVDGDVLIVSDIYRLGRSISEIIGMSIEILEKGAAVFAVDGEYDLGNSKRYGAIPCLLSILLEAKKELALAGTKGPKDRIPVNGTPTLGRPIGSIGVSRLNGKEDEIVQFLKLNVSKAEIARRMNVSRPALHDFIVSRKLLQKS
jgi:DNA invertase Pin-like site-specific DNA recombinase